VVPLPAGPDAAANPGRSVEIDFKKKPQNDTRQILVFYLL